MASAKKSKRKPLKKGCKVVLTGNTALGDAYPYLKKGLKGIYRGRSAWDDAFGIEFPAGTLMDGSVDVAHSIGGLIEEETGYWFQRSEFKVV